MVYGRTLDGTTYTFGVSGKLYRNAFIMFDRETDTLWLHLSGQAIKGKLVGKTLPVITTTGMVRWKNWRRAHPETKVLSVRGREDMPDSYRRYHSSDTAGIRPVRNRDDRLPVKSVVMGIRAGAARKAYPLSALKKSPVIQDRIGKTDAVIFYESETGATLAFDATVDKKKLEFEDQLDGTRVKDKGTGSTWDLRSGRAVEGKMKGKRMKELIHVDCYWFAWADYYPKTEVYTP